MPNVDFHKICLQREKGADTQCRHVPSQKALWMAYTRVVPKLSSLIYEKTTQQQWL